MVVRGPRMSDHKYFAASFDLYIGGGTGGGTHGENRTGGEGVSVCLGDLPDAPFGESGAGEGLRVSLLTEAEVVEVHYDRELIMRRHVERFRFRAERFVPMRVEYGPLGLSIHVDGFALADQVLLEAWSPLPTWRFGMGARTSERTDEHRVDNLRLTVGAEVDPRSALVEVSSNGQQFTASRVPFVYNAPHVVSSFTPERGPEAGSTQVMISGMGFAAGSDYKCRFGDSTVNASYDAISGTLHCASAPHSRRTTPLEVFINL